MGSTPGSQFDRAGSRVQQLWEPYPPGFPLAPGAILWHQNIPRCSNRGNNIPLASPQRLVPFHSIEIFPDAAAIMGNTFHTCCRRLLGAPPPGKKIPCTAGLFLHIYVGRYPFNRHFFGIKCGGIFEKKKTEKKTKKRKIPLFSTRLASGLPDDPPYQKTGSKRLGLRPENPFL